MSIWLTTRFMRKNNYLHGSFIKLPDVDGYINSLNPGDTRDVIGRFPFSETGADIAVGCAREAFPAWHRLGTTERRNILQRFRMQLETSQEPLVAYLMRETGKPMWETQAEVVACIRHVEVSLDQGAQQLEPWRLTDLEGGCEFHPRGVAVVLGCYNLPLLTPVAQLVPALLAGNTIVFKPSKYTPAIGQLIAELIDRARLPRGVFNLVQGNGGSVGKRLAANPDVDILLMEGSIETGLDIRQTTLAQPWKRLVLNTCGRGTAIILDDADVDKAVYELISGAYLTTGQRRSSTARVIVTRPIAERVSNRLRQVIARLQIGHGYRNDIFFGPLISEKYRKAYLGWAEAMQQEGHTMLAMGERLDLDPPGYFVTPTLARVNPKVAREVASAELVVGPALEMQVVDDFAHAVEVHNQSRLGLVTSLFTRSVELAREARFLLRTGALNVNRSTISLSARLPLEGFGASSAGYPSGIYAARACSFPVAWLDDQRAFERSQLMPGIHWPEFQAEDDHPTRILPQYPAADEDGGEMTVSDLLIPQEDEVTPVVSSGAANANTASVSPAGSSAVGSSAVGTARTAMPQGPRGAVYPAASPQERPPARPLELPSNPQPPPADPLPPLVAAGSLADHGLPPLPPLLEDPFSVPWDALAAGTPVAPTAPSPLQSTGLGSDSSGVAPLTFHLPIQALPTGNARGDSLPAPAQGSLELPGFSDYGGHSEEQPLPPLDLNLGTDLNLASDSSDMPTITGIPAHGAQPRVVIFAGPGRSPSIDEDEVTPPMGIPPVRE